MHGCYQMNVYDCVIVVEMVFDVVDVSDVVDVYFSVDDVVSVGVADVDMMHVVSCLNVIWMDVVFVFVLQLMLDDVLGMEDQHWMVYYCNIPVA